MMRRATSGDWLMAALALTLWIGCVAMAALR